MGDNFEEPIKSAQGKNFEKNFFGNFQKISKVSKNIFWASYDHVVAQKSIFWTKISKKVVNTIPPLFSYCRDIRGSMLGLTFQRERPPACVAGVRGFLRDAGMCVACAIRPVGSARNI